VNIRHLPFIFFVLLFFGTAKAEVEDLGLNPFLTQEERQMFREKSKYEELIGPELSAILYSPGDSKAVIDGKIVKEGDMIYGKKVIGITQEAVILTDFQHKFILKLNMLISSADSVTVEQRKDKDE